MRQHRVFPTVLGTVVAILVLAASAGAALGPVETLTPAMTTAREPRVAVDSDGNAVAIFFYGDETIGGEPAAYCNLEYGDEDYCTVGSRSWLADGTLSPQQDLSARFSGMQFQGIDVAMDEQGRAAAVWAGTSIFGSAGGAVLRARLAGGSWSTVETLSPDPFHPEVGLDNQGGAVAAWLHPVPVGIIVRDHVQARARSATGTLSPVQDVSPAGVAAWNPRVAVEPDGDALFVWQAQLSLGSGDWTVQARARDADGTLSPIQNLSQAGANAWNPQVELEADGDAIVVWQLGLSHGIQARARASDGTLSSVQTLSSVPRGDVPQVALHDDGRAVVVWRGREPDGDTGVRARARSATGAWSALEAVSLPVDMGEVGEPQVATDDSGRAVVVWTQESRSSLYQPLQVRARSSDGVWSAVENLSEPRALAWQPQVDVSPGGEAVVVWEDHWSYSDHRDWGPAIVATRFGLDELPPDLTPPQTTITAGPTGTTTRRTATFRFRASQPWSVFQCRLDLGMWRPCSSPRRYAGLAVRAHVFRVRALDPSGNVDPTPARRAFRVLRG